MHAAAQDGIGFPQFGVAQLLRREIGLHRAPLVAALSLIHAGWQRQFSGSNLPGPEAQHGALDHDS